MPGLPQQRRTAPSARTTRTQEAPLTEQKPAGHWLARRWSDPTAASKPCLVLVLALVVPRARPGPLLAFGTEGRYSRKYLPRGFHSLFRSCSCSFLPFGLQFPPLPTWLLLLLLLHNLTFLTFHFTFAFCLPRLPFLDGSFFDASSAASTITSTPTTAPNVDTLLLIRIRSRRHCYLTRARLSFSTQSRARTPRLYHQTLTLFALLGTPFQDASVHFARCRRPYADQEEQAVDGRPQATPANRAQQPSARGS